MRSRTCDRGPHVSLCQKTTQTGPTEVPHRGGACDGGSRTDVRKTVKNNTDRMN